jgi:integrase
LVPITGKARPAWPAADLCANRWRFCDKIWCDKKFCHSLLCHNFFAAVPALKRVRKEPGLARQMAGIQKDASPHSLRPGFATHLPEKGIAIRYIKELPGRCDMRTTGWYLPVRREQWVNRVRPLDDLWDGGKL